MDLMKKDDVGVTNEHELRFLGAFETLGTRHPGAPSKFNFVLSPHWTTPSFSPLVLNPTEVLHVSDLRAVEQLFAKVRSPNRHVPDTPYLAILKDRYANGLEQLDHVLQAGGWLRDERSFTINFFHGSATAAIPEGLTVEVVPFFGDPLPSPYANLLRAGFGADTDYVSYVEKVFRAASSPTWIVLLRLKDEVIAGGAVSVRSPWAFLTWGTVLPAHRGKGYHQALLNSCRTVGNAHGAHASVLTTRNPLVMGRGDEMVELIICRATGQP
jgi:GNAT superfamily N-acetyltransferase